MGLVLGAKAGGRGAGAGGYGAGTGVLGLWGRSCGAGNPQPPSFWGPLLPVYRAMLPKSGYGDSAPACLPLPRGLDTPKAGGWQPPPQNTAWAPGLLQKPRTTGLGHPGLLLGFPSRSSWARGHRVVAGCVCGNRCPLSLPVSQGRERGQQQLGVATDPTWGSTGSPDPKAVPEAVPYPQSCPLGGGGVLLPYNLSPKKHRTRTGGHEDGSGCLLGSAPPPLTPRLSPTPQMGRQLQRWGLRRDGGAPLPAPLPAGKSPIRGRGRP